MLAKAYLAYFIYNIAFVSSAMANVTTVAERWESSASIPENISQ
jgi:hypothetical protein